MAHKADAVDLRIVASKHIGWLRRRQSRDVLKSHLGMDLKKTLPGQAQITRDARYKATADSSGTASTNMGSECGIAAERAQTSRRARKGLSGRGSKQRLSRVHDGPRSGNGNTGRWKCGKAIVVSGYQKING